jgi:DNA-binding GntR family transcriptional regulator
MVYPIGLISLASKVTRCPKSEDESLAKTRIVEGEKVLFDHVLDDIATGRIESGTRLKIQDLAAAYDTSVNPVREVLRQLQGMGLVRILPNRGAMVPKTDANIIRDLFEVLSLFEPYFMQWFAEMATSDDIAYLSDIQDQIDGLTHEQKPEFSALDQKFHAHLCERHYNRRAVESWQSHRMAYIVFTRAIPLSPSRFEQAKVEHRDMIEACRVHDVESALRTLNRHILGAGEMMYRNFRVLEDPAKMR